MSQREYYLKNRERILAQTKQRRLENPKKRKEQQRADIEKNGEKRRAKQAEWRAANPDKLMSGKKRWFQENKATIYEKRKTCAWKEREKEYNAEYAKNNKERLAEIKNKYVRLNPEKVRAAKKKYSDNNIQCKIRKRLHGRIRDVLKLVKAKKCAGTVKLLGCTVVELAEYFEGLFKDGMTWENHGKFGWHIDHIIPCAAFDLTKPEEQLKCFHYTNLQPLWWLENLSKGKKTSE